MNAEQFVWWLHGFFEIAQPKTLNEEQTKVVADHLRRFFVKGFKVDPVAIEKAKETLEKSQDVFFCGEVPCSTSEPFKKFPFSVCSLETQAGYVDSCNLKGVSGPGEHAAHSVLKETKGPVSPGIAQDLSFDIPGSC